MNKNKIIQWIKGNVVIVATVFFSVLCMGFTGFVTFFMQSSVVEPVEKKVASQTDESNQLMNRTVTVPGANPGDPDFVKKGVTINQHWIDDKAQINATYIQAGRAMREQTQKRNSEKHENYCVLPASVDSTTRDDAFKVYRNSISAPLWNPKLGADPLMEEDRKKVAMNLLFAGTPLSTDELQKKADEVVKARVSGFGAEKLADLSPKQQEQVQIRAHNAVLEAIRERAQNVGVYVESTDVSSTANPFSGLIRDWSRIVPTPDVLYESQADLWILRDMVEAIRVANHLDKDGASVVNGPVKRLISLKINRDGYVGLHTMGWAAGSTAAGTGLVRPAFDLQTEDKLQVENFLASPTGRISNALYDVKQARLEVIVDAQRIPELFNAIDGVNSMTVLNVAVEDVDEYKELRDGHYYYGPCDVVKASILVETLWMRSWTAAKMPEATKAYLRISTPSVLPPK